MVVCSVNYYLKTWISDSLIITRFRDQQEGKWQMQQVQGSIHLCKTVKKSTAVCQKWLASIPFLLIFIPSNKDRCLKSFGWWEWDATHSGMWAEWGKGLPRTGGFCWAERTRESQEASDSPKPLSLHLGNEPHTLSIRAVVDTCTK